MVRVVLDNALARVTVPTTRPSRHFVVSLIDEASTLGPFDGMHIHLRETGLMGAVDMAPLVEVVKKHVEPGRPVTILGSGATVIPALGALMTGLQARAVLFSAGSPTDTVLPGVEVLYDPAEPEQQRDADAWRAAGAMTHAIIGLGAWPRRALEVPGFLQAVLRSDGAFALRQMVRAGRRSSAYLLMTLACRLRRRRAFKAEGILAQAAALDSPLRSVVLFELAETRRLRGQLRSALDAYRQALMLNPDSAWYWLRASETASTLTDARPDELAFAARAARRASNLAPDTPAIRLNQDSMPARQSVDPQAEAGWWLDLERQNFVAVRSALALLKHARPNDADSLIGMLEDVRQGKLAPDQLTLDRLLDCMADGTLIRLRHGTLEASSRLSLKVVTEEVLVDQEYGFYCATSEPRVVDCGVNFGLSLYSTLAAYPHARILGFEPNPELFELAQANIRRNGWQDRIDLRAIAISAEDGTANLYLSDEDDMAGSLTTRIADQGRPITQVEVEAHRLSRYLDRPTDFLKIDIEGVEHDVLAECCQKLDQVATLFCEYHHATGLAEDRLGQILKTLWDAGFDTHVTSSPWVRRKFPHTPGSVAGHPHSLSLFARRR